MYTRLHQQEGLFTWQRRWGLWGHEGVLALGDHTDPVLVGVTVEIVPPGEGPVGAAHHLHTLLTVLVVVGLAGAPVGVGERRAVTPRVAWRAGSSHLTKGVTRGHVPDWVEWVEEPTSSCRVVLEADPLAAAFAVQGQELLLLLVVDADQVSVSSQTVLTSSAPALPLGPVHIVEELWGKKQKKIGTERKFRPCLIPSRKCFAINL